MKMWTIRWPDGCRHCHAKKRIHMGQGYCTRCYRRLRIRGVIKPIRRTARTRVRGGDTEFFCYDCSNWKSPLTAKHLHRTRCHECHVRIRREQYRRDRDHVTELRRAREARLTTAVRKADALRKTKKTLRDPWGANRGVVPLAIVQEWLDRAYIMTPNRSWGSVAHLVGLNERRLRTIRTSGYPVKVSVDVAEAIAAGINAMDEFREVMTPGVDGWSKHSNYCLRCGRYDVPHHALGFCRRCYHTVWWHRKKGRSEAPLPREERWSTWYLGCVECGSREHAHQAFGFCRPCYQKHRR